MKSYTQYNLAQHSTAQHSTAQHSTAQHSTAQHSTAQHSTAAYCNLNKITIALSLFSTIFIPFYSQAESVSHLGTAIGTNSVAVGQDSLATSTSGVANGHGAIATGNNFTREELNTKKQENKTALNNVNNKQNQLNHTNNQLTATDNAITSLNAQITELSKQQDTIRDKIENRNTLLNEKSVIQSNLDNKNSEVSTAKTNLDRLQANGKKYSNFTDMLRTLDWNKLDGNNIDTSRNELANDLKNIVDTNFNELSDKYNQQDYRRVIDGFINRQASYQGSVESFANTIGHNRYDEVLKINGMSSRVDSMIAIFNNNFLKQPLNETTYIDNNDYKLEYLEPLSFSKNIITNEELKTFSQKLGITRFGARESYLGEQGIIKRNNNLSSDNIFHMLDSWATRLNNVYSQKTLNTVLLQIASLKKSKQNREFNALSERGEGTTSFREGILKDLYLDDNINLDGFAEKYNAAAFHNYSIYNRITFSLKGKSGEKIETRSIDSNIAILSKLKELTPDTSLLISSQDIASFRLFYTRLNEYKNNIDWEFDKSAINLDDYKTKLDKVIAYNEKIKNAIDIYESILDERKKTDGGDKAFIENKTNELIRLKQEVLDGTNDITNFLAGIKLTYNKEWADYYLNYAKDETDALVSRINSELKLYDDKGTIAVDITNKIKEFTDAYNNAVENRDNIQAQLNDLNRQIDNLALTTSEIAVDDLKRDKEQELAVRQADKERLEREKQEAEKELERLKEILAASSLANLGQNSYAQGKDAFASGNDSIAIGTSSISTGTDAVAIGHQSQALATSAVALGKSAQVIANANKGVAIGDSAVVNHKNSVAIGAGSTTVRGAQAGPYNAPIGGELTDASFATGSIGEFSVGADGKLRQITHVAAGTADTDAVNVWQLTTAITKLKEALEQNPPAGPQGEPGPKGDKGDKGDTGAQGPQGERGEKGDTGAQGLKGDKGEKGDTGAQGLKGDKGDKGETGAQGLKGDKGDTGAAGPKGDKGDTGAAGPKGDKGDTGAAGPKGDKGDTGAAGPKGDKGDTGATGPKGDKGDTGVAGPKGDKGDTGVAGPKGDKGDTGVAGPKGDKGDTGATGPKGDKGDTGATGPKGDKGDTGVAGPKGDKGDTGATGPKGDKGDTGATGPKGDKGDTGATGPKGDKGDTGAAGPKGDKGDTGVAGPKGDKGDTGATGPKGDKGDTGATGPKGDKGDTGAAGPKGDKGDTGVAGPKGDKGDTGVAGPKGDKGDTGATGPKGDKGDTGVAGPKGDKGDTGAAGPKGDKGDTGVAGPKGDKGDTGATGPKGDKGDTGATGPKGDKGDTGAAGPKGDKGDTGATGPKGDKGDTGAAGPKGDKGDTGATGPKGDKGDTGAAGPKGDKGDTGVAGPKGDKGDTGVAGPKGDKGDTGAAGPKGDKGDTGATGPKGDKGDTGASGPKGDKGDTGVAGPKGDKGDTGVAGPKGDKGDTGVAGPKGDKGDTGVAGPKGDKGDTGASGPKGDKGDTGAAGPKGDKGDTGVAGPKGDKGDTGVAGPKGDKGDTGATGPKGDKGDVGPQGPAGRDGIVGRVTTYTVSGKEKPDQEIVEAINQINSEGIKYVHVNDESAELPNENRINGDASASGRYAIAIGHLSEAIASDSIAVGHNAKANIVNSVALGSNAITVSEQTEYTAGTQSYTHSQAINRLNQMVHQFAGADAIGTVSLGKVGAERRVQHVAAGLISEKSTDAINGSQLHALATAIDKGQLGLVRQEYDENTIHNGVNHNRLTVGAGTGGQEVSFANAGGENRRLAGVAEGINANDAVNKGQLDRAVGKTISRINYIEKKLKGGVANAVAMAGLSQAYLPSQGLVSVGVGNYSGVSSIAVGMSHISDNGKVILRVGGSASQKGTAAASASVGFAW